MGEILSGYRSLLRFEGGNADFGFELTLGSATRTTGLVPGTSGEVRLSFWAVDDLPPLFAGQKFEIREGDRVVGIGEVVTPELG